MPTGGIAVWTDHFLKHCQKQSITCHLVNTETTRRRNSTGKRNLADELFRSIRIFSNLRKELRANTFDAVYLNTSCGTYGLFRDALVAYLVRKKSIPLITHYHCEIPFWVKRKSSISCLGYLTKVSKQNLVLCKNSESFIRNHYGINARTVPNFVDASIVLQTDKPIRPTIKQVFFVGRVTEVKGAKELFDVACKLPAITFKLAGNVDKVVRKWKKPQNVQLLGHISNTEVIRHLDQSDLFLFPSHTEGCSIALIECLARGVPAIASDVGANADVLRDGCGIVVPFGDVTAIVNTIQQLQDPVVRKKLSQKSVQRAKEKYTDENLYGIIDIFHHLIP